MVNKIKKRDGRKVKFDQDKILRVLQRVINSVHPDDTLSSDELQIAKNLTRDVINRINDKFNDDSVPKVEEIQDIVQGVLISAGMTHEAKNFIEYRQKRTAEREYNSDLTKTYRKMLTSKAQDMDLMRENANIDGNSVMGTMLRIGSEANKNFIDKYILKPEYSFAHSNGDFHIHDKDFYELTSNCLFVPVGKLLKNGFNTGHGFIRQPQGIQSAASLCAICIQSEQNDQFGGVGVATFDWDLAPYVAKSYAKNITKILDLFVATDHSISENVKNVLDEIYEKYNTVFSEEAQKEVTKVVYYYTSVLPDYDFKTKLVLDKAKEYTEKETFQAMEALIHNLNSMHSRAGAQVPFSSLNYGTNTTEEGRMIIRNVLLATEKGMGNGETPIFPVQIFKMKKGVNFEKGEPNYDLFELACRVSAKRLFPNFVYIDAPQNIIYYKEGRPETEMAAMGAVRGDGIVSVKVHDTEYYNIPIATAMKYIKEATKFDEPHGDYSEFADLNVCGVYKITHIPTNKYYIGSSKNVRRRFNEHRYSIRRYGHLGENYKLDDFNLDNYHFEFLENANPDLLWETESVYIKDDGLCVNRKDPRNNGNFNSENRLKALAGRQYTDIDPETRACSYVKHVNDVYVMSRGQWEPVRSIIINSEYTPLKIYEVSFRDQTLFLTEDHPLHTKRGRIQAKDLVSGDIIYDSNTFEEVVITDVKLSEEKCITYDFEVSNDIFDLNGIISHNCRTRTISNVNGDSITVGRGNFSFTTLNLPRLGIEAKGDWDKFFTKLDYMMDLAKEQLEARYELISHKHVYNFPFAYGQHCVYGSEDLAPNDEIKEALKNYSISIGFIGLAECMVAMTGHHHGEGKQYYDQALKIIQHMRERTDHYTEDTHMNWSLFATPAEGLSSRFTRIDKKKYGIIPGVTDRDYYTNSFHIPVYFDITAGKKMELEGPFHELCNAGSITYVEANGDFTKNLEAFEDLVKYGLKCGLNYFAINHPVDSCPVCGYTGIIDDECPCCGFKDGDTEMDYDKLVELQRKGMLRNIVLREMSCGACHEQGETSE